jgi:thiamine transport system permease protein
LSATLLAGWGYRRLASRQAGRLDLRARREARRRPRSAGERALLGGVVSGVLLLTLPLAALAWRSLTLPLAPRLPAELTLTYYRLLGENPRGALFFVPPLRAIGNSLGFALIAMALALAVGGMAALAIHIGARRRDGSGTAGWGPRALYRLLDIACTLPLGVSAVMLGLGYLVAWGPTGALRSPLLIPAVHALLAFPFVVRALVPALDGRSRRLPEAARMLGARPWRVLRAIELPLLAPALLSAAIFAFTASLGEFGAALLLSRPEYPTIPLVIARLLGQPGAANYGQALALSTILMLVSLAGFLLIERVRPEGIGAI